MGVTVSPHDAEGGNVEGRYALLANKNDIDQGSLQLRAGDGMVSKVNQSCNARAS